MMRLKLTNKTLAVFLLGAALVESAHAQYTSVIEGTVNDQSGASSQR